MCSKLLGMFLRMNELYSMVVVTLRYFWPILRFFPVHGSNDVESSADHFYAASNALNASKYDSLHYHVINDVIIMKHMSNKSL